MGATLGAGWTKAGHQVVYGVRNPLDEKAQALAKSQPKARVASNREAAREAEVVALATPWDATESAVRDCGSTARRMTFL